MACSEPENSVARIRRLARERELECRRIVLEARDSYMGCTFDIWRGKMKPPKARVRDAAAPSDGPWSGS